MGEEVSQQVENKKIDHEVIAGSSSGGEWLGIMNEARK